MSSMEWSPGAALPLLLELARSLRARRFYLPSDPALAQVLRRSAGVWTATLRRGGDLELSLTGAGFGLPDGNTVSGPGVSELARELARARVAVIAFDAALPAEDYLHFVETLAACTDAANLFPDLPQAVAREGIETIRTRSRVEAEISPPPEEAAAASVPDDTAELPRGPIDAQAEAIDTLLAALEQSIDISEYERIADELAEVLGGQIDEKDFVDGYRVALVFGRHCCGGGAKLPSVQDVAASALRKLVLSSDELQRIAVQRVYGSESGSVVEAIQLLVALGPEIVPKLLDEHMRGTPAAQARTPQILVAIGDPAIPALVDELSSHSPARVRRAVRLLGDLQSPRGESFVADMLTHADPTVRREAAKAIGQIGTERGVEHLVAAIDDEVSAEAAVFGLGFCRGASIGPSLIEMLSTGDRPEGVLREAVTSLGRLREPAAIKVLSRVLRRGGVFRRAKYRALRLAAVEALGQIGGRRALGVLERYSSGGDIAVREACKLAVRQARARSDAEASSS